MKKEKLGGEPAFPMVNQEGLPGIISVVCDKVSGKPVTVGMSKRFYAACAALKSPLLRTDDLCDDDMVEDDKGYYVKYDCGYFIPTDIIVRKRYSVKPDATEFKRIIRYAYKLADELLTHENE